MPVFSDLALARRLEAAEGFACAQYALARLQLFPDRGSQAVRIAGADVVYDGVDAPTTQTFGLGLFEEPTAENLSRIEKFFEGRGAPVLHEVSPFAGTSTFELLCQLGYSPIEISSVLYRSPAAEDADFSAGLPGDRAIKVREIGPEEAALWTDISTRGWTHDHPEFTAFMREFGRVLTAREGTVCFLAESDGAPGAAGSLAIHGGVALFAGATTVPELRRHGLQTALVQSRMQWARKHDCDLAMMVAEVGSNSQRNAQRAGFEIAYTRMKWKKQPPASSL